MADPNNVLTPRINEGENRLTETEKSLKKNLIINGGMDFFQRGSGINNLYGYRSVDRFKVGHGTVDSNTSQNTDVPGVANIFNSLKITPNATNTPTAAQFGVIEQYIEGNISRDYYDGKLVLSFYFKSNKLGTYSAYLRSGTAPIITNTQEFVVDQTGWQRYIFKYDLSGINKDNYGFDTDTEKGLLFGITLTAGSNFEATTLGEWVDGNFISSPNQVNFYDNIANTCYLTGVMLHEGEVASDFQRAGRNYMEELQLCQRYYEKTYLLEDPPGTLTTNGMQYWANSSNTLNASRRPIFWGVRKRVIPLVVTYSPSSSTPNRVLGNSVNLVVCESRWLSSQGGSVGWASSILTNIQLHWTADAEL
jgi:hypothetical protein